MTVGPYDSERETWAEPMPRAVNALHDSGRVKSGDPDRLVRNTVLGAMVQACGQAGVNLGDFDIRVLDGLARGELSTAQVVIGLISRAHGAGRKAGGR